jgi:hypothetical protein
VKNDYTSFLHNKILGESVNLWVYRKFLVTNLSFPLFLNFIINHLAIKLQKFQQVSKNIMHSKNIVAGLFLNWSKLHLVDILIQPKFTQNPKSTISGTILLFVWCQMGEYNWLAQICRFDWRILNSMFLIGCKYPALFTSFK